MDKSTSCDSSLLLEIIYPVLFEYIDSITIRNIILSFSTLKYKPKCLMTRYWSKNERVFRLNKYKITERKATHFEYELIRINITSPQQFLSFYWENDKFQQNLDTKILSYYIALKNNYFCWDIDEIEYVDLNLKVISVDLWDVMSWCSSVHKITNNANIHYFNTNKPYIESILWNGKKFNDLNNEMILKKWRDKISVSDELVFGFADKNIFIHLRDLLILPNLLSGGDIIKEWYCCDYKVGNKKGTNTFNQIFGCIDESNVTLNEWNDISYDCTKTDGILLKYVTFIMWKGTVPKRENKRKRSGKSKS